MDTGPLVVRREIVISVCAPGGSQGGVETEDYGGSAPYGRKICPGPGGDVFAAGRTQGSSE